jgi:hypothetical protein
VDTSYNRIPQGIPVSILCDVLAASATIRYLTHSGMLEMIARCIQLELLQLKELKDPKLRYMRDAIRTRWMWTAE